MEEHPLTDWSYSNLANFLITLALVKGQVVLVAGVQHHTLGTRVVCAPVMHSL
ncbi:hypothetical protein D3C73_1663850 [compost metagenome]